MKAFRKIVGGWVFPSLLACSGIVLAACEVPTATVEYKGEVYVCVVKDTLPAKSDTLSAIVCTDSIYVGGGVTGS